MPDESGVSPLEAVARTLWEADHSQSWEAAARTDKQGYRDLAVAALTAAIEALPEQALATFAAGWEARPRTVKRRDLFRRALLG